MILFFCLLFIFAISIYYVNQNELLRGLLTPYINKFGLSYKDMVYTHVSKIMSPINVFDLVLLSIFYDKIYMYYLFHGKMKVIHLSHIPVGHRLIYLVNNKSKPLPKYERGVPFFVNEGYLSLQKRERKGMFFSYSEVARSKTWPMTGL